MTTKVYVNKNGEAVIPADTLKAWGIKPFTEIEIDIRTPSDGKEFPPEIPQGKTVQDFLDEFESRYGMTSEEFYEKWQRGETEDEPELNEWAGFYRLKLSLKEEGKDPTEATFNRYIPEEIENHV